MQVNTRKVMIGMKGDLSGSFNNSMAMIATPSINGNNLFTGAYDGDADRIGAVVDTQESWENYWKELKTKPPGRLPEGAIAVFQAVHEDGRGISIEPATVVQDGSEIMINWHKKIILKAEDMSAHSHYAVLLLPRGMLSATFMDSFPLAEQRMRMEDLSRVLDSIKTGGGEVEAPTKAMFMKKYKYDGMKP